MPLKPFADAKKIIFLTPIIYKIEFLGTCAIKENGTHITEGDDYFLLKINYSMMMITDLENWSCVEYDGSAWDAIEPSSLVDGTKISANNGPVFTGIDRDIIASYIVGLTS